MSGEVAAMEIKRVGVIVPSLNVVAEDDLRLLMPPDVRYHIARARFKKEGGRVTHKSLVGLAAEAPTIAGALYDAGMDAIAFNCTGSCVAAGLGASERIVAQIESETGTPATTTVLAIIRALHALGMKRLVHCSPFTAEFSDEEADYLRNSGFDVVATAGMGHTDALAVAKMTPEQIYDFALGVDRPDADGIFLSCANARAAEAVDPLERKLGKPVISSNQAVIWDLLRLVGRQAAGDRIGSLFREHARAAA
jgi:maleate isomerase